MGGNSNYGRKFKLLDWRKIERYDGRRLKDMIGGNDFLRNLKMDWSAREPLWERERWKRAVVVA